MLLLDERLVDDLAHREETPVDQAVLRVHDHSQLSGPAFCVLCIHMGDRYEYTSHRQAGYDLLRTSISTLGVLIQMQRGKHQPHLTFLCLQASQLFSASGLGISNYSRGRKNKDEERRVSHGEQEKDKGSTRT